MSSNLKDKWVVITGASSGFGAAAARAFGSLGTSVMLGARRVDLLAQVAQEVRQAGARAEYHPLDVGSTGSVTEFFRTVQQHTREVHVLVNNAGGAHGLDTVAEGRDSDWDAMVQSNLLGVLRVTRAALPMIPHNSGASVINIGSIAGRVAYEGGSAYCAVKAGELQITRALRLELCGTGIRVSTIDPGLAETEFSITRFKGDTVRAQKVYAGMTPLSAEDIAETIVWVAGRPAHVNIDELLIKPVDQAAIHKVFRRAT